jgi:hypothetical protein
MTRKLPVQFVAASQDIFVRDFASYLILFVPGAMESLVMVKAKPEKQLG